MAASALSTASRPSHGLADHVEVGLGVEDHAEAGADQGLVVGDEDADAHAASLSFGIVARTRKPPPYRRAGLEVAATQRDALAHARAGPARRGPRRRRGAAARPFVGVRDVEFESVVGPAQQHDRPGAVAGVLQRVGERFLHDAVGGEVAAHRQRERLALEVQLDRQAGVARALDELVEAGERRLRLAHRAVSSPSRIRPSRRRSSLERLAPAALDLAQRRHRLARVARRARAAPRPTGRPSPKRSARRRRAARARSGGARRSRPPRLRLALDLEALVAQRELARQQRAVASPRATDAVIAKMTTGKT